MKSIGYGADRRPIYAPTNSGERAAVMYTLIGTAKLNDVAPQAWLADVLARIAEIPQTRLHELLPWHWKADREQDPRRITCGLE